MHKLKVVIVDDEENVREAIKQLLILYCQEATVVAEAGSVSKAIVAIETHKPDVVLLDIDIIEGNGFDVLKSFPSPTFRTIFITAFQEYAIQAFRFSAFDYLLKPVDPELLAQSIKKVQDVMDREKISVKIDSFLYNMNNLTKGSKKIVLKTADSIHVVNMQDIMYCEAERSYTNFYLSDKSRIMVSNTLGDYEEMFSEDGFLRVHQSYLLNVQYIKRYEKGDGGKVILSDNSSVPVATRKKDQLMQFLATL